MNTRAFSVQLMSVKIKSDKATTAWYVITPTKQASCLIKVVLDLNLLSLVTSSSLGHWPTECESETTRYYFRTSGNSYNLFLSSVFCYQFFSCYESEFDLITLNQHEYCDRRSDFSLDIGLINLIIYSKQYGICTSFRGCKTPEAGRAS